MKSAITNQRTFVAPRPRRLRKKGGPGTELELASNNFCSLPFARGAWKPYFFLRTFKRNTVSTLKETCPNVFQTQTFSVGTFWIQVRETTSHKVQLIVFGHAWFILGMYIKML